MSPIHGLDTGWVQMDDEPIRSHTSRDAQQAATRMKAWADGAGHSLLISSLLEEDWLNLARVALELRPR